MKESENFFEKVYQVARLIPYGKVTSYGSIANYLGASNALLVCKYLKSKITTVGKLH